MTGSRRAIVGFPELKEPSRYALLKGLSRLGSERTLSGTRLIMGWLVEADYEPGHKTAGMRRASRLMP
jgi:hypothetical protein